MAAFRPIWPLVGVVTQGFSASHPALDIAANVGTPVRAIAPGTVLDVDYDTLDQQPLGTGYAGYWITIAHPDGWLSRYIHLSPFSERVLIGDSVACGQVIADSGITGTSTGGHLHLDIWNTSPACPETIYRAIFDLYACDPLGLLPATPPGSCGNGLPGTIRASLLPLALLGIVSLGMVLVQRPAR